MGSSSNQRPDNISLPESEPEIIRITKDFDLKAILTEQLQTNSDTEKKICSYWVFLRFVLEEKFSTSTKSTHLPSHFRYTNPSILFTSMYSWLRLWGCIIAHFMGLGKTFTTIAFLQTIMNHDTLSSEYFGRTAMVLCPKNVYQNWYDEFRKWTKSIDRNHRIPGVNQLKQCYLHFLCLVWSSKTALARQVIRIRLIAL